MSTKQPNDQMSLLIKQFEEECDQLKESASTIETNFKQLQDLENSLVERVSLKTQEVKKLQIQCAELQFELQSHASTQNSLQLEIHATEQQTQALLVELPQFQSKIQMKLEQSQRIRDRLSQMELATKSKRETQSKKETSLLKKEKTLQNYRKLLHAQAAHVQEMANALSSLMKESQTLLPLLDYLTLTEFELKQAETQLSKTAESFPDRKKLEEGVIQLINQKNFLVSSIQETQRALETEIQSLQPFTLDLELPSHLAAQEKEPQA